MHSFKPKTFFDFMQEQKNKGGGGNAGAPRADGAQPVEKPRDHGISQGDKGSPLYGRRYVCESHIADIDYSGPMLDNPTKITIKDLLKKDILTATIDNGYVSDVVFIDQKNVAQLLTNLTSNAEDKREYALHKEINRRPNTQSGFTEYAEKLLSDKHGLGYDQGKADALIGALLDEYGNDISMAINILREEHLDI